MRGRKPKPTALKLVTGNPGKRALNIDEPAPEGGIPDRPKWLRGDGKKEWDRVVKVMAGTGVITKADGSMLAAYCQLYGQFVTAVRDDLPFTASMISQMRALAAAFGLEPSSRGRLSGNPKGGRSKWES